MISRFLPFALLLLMLTWSASAATPATPNIVVILADDFGYGSAGCYGADPKLVKTPHIDRLAREGRRFTDANTTSSVCSPTRYSLLTGRYGWRTETKSGVLSTLAALSIEPARLNMASLLKARGYRSAAIGKWHLGYGTAEARPKWKADFTGELSPGPLDLGFDYHFGVPGNHGDLTGAYVLNRWVYGLRSGKIPAGLKLPAPAAHDQNFQATYTSADTEAGRVTPLEIDAPRRRNIQVMPLLTSQTVQWLEEQQAGTPFFLYYTPVAVHNPVTPEADLAGKSAAGLYGDWIHQLDRSVGAVLDTLDRKGFAKDTLVIFTSDNGGVVAQRPVETPQMAAAKAGLAVNGRLRGGKHNVWEGGFKVPFLVRWPGRVPAGTECHEMVSVADLLATTAALVGSELPAPAQAAEDSFNILPLLLGEAGAKSPRPDMIVHSSDGVFAIRLGPWKWIEGVPVENAGAPGRKKNSPEFRPQLYHTGDDPGETRDVSAEHPEVVRELSALLTRYRDGGFSRALPPVVEKRVVTPAAFEEPAGEVIVRDAFDRVPTAPANVTRPTWTAQDGALWGAQPPKEQAGATVRMPLGITNGSVQYELCFRGADRHSMRVEAGVGKASFRIEVSRGHVGITKNPDPGQSKDQVEPLARKTLELKDGTWYPLRVTFRGSEATAEIAGVTVKGTHQILGEPKAAMNLIVFGDGMGVRRLVVAKQ